ncbi:MAG: class I SAM-dependent methyltransferase [Candidatus Thorarchaeota archaeon]
MASGQRPKTWGAFWDLFGFKLAESIGIREGARVLDVGTGGGSTLFPALEMVGTEGHVTGIDKNDDRVKTVTAEIERCDIKNAQVLQMDGSQMEFEDDSFDFVIAGFMGWSGTFDFVTCEFRERDLVMGDIYRVLKPDGIVGISTWLVQEDLDLMHRELSSASIPSNTNYSAETEEGWNVIMATTKFRDVRFVTESVVQDYGSADDWWDEMKSYNWVPDQEDAEVITESVKAEVLRSVQSHTSRESGPLFKKLALFILARK